MKVNSNFFKTWTEESSYVLGYIIGDGCISRSGDRLRLSIVSSELVILGKIKDSMQSLHKISKSGNGGFSFTISDQDLLEDLLKLGVRPNKTKLGLSCFPEVPSDFERHLVRGLLDSDGSCTCSGGGFHVVWVCTDRKMAEWIAELVPVTTGIYKQTTKTGFEIFHVTAYRLGDMITLYSYLYDDSILFNSRKRVKFKNWLDERGFEAA
jgi:hypothetical protein